MIYPTHADKAIDFALADKEAAAMAKIPPHVDIMAQNLGNAYLSLRTQLAERDAQLAAERELLDRALGKLRYISAQGEANYPGFNRVAKMNADEIIKTIEAHKVARQPTQDKGE